jgi:5-carboxymethyl-2-hydroxymuconate isomerase
VPHLTIEYSSNVTRNADMQKVVTTAHDALMSTGVFEVGAVRVRAVECQIYSITDRHPDNAFVDLSLRIGDGRSPEDKKRVGETVYAAVRTLLEPLFASPHFALSFEIREIDSALSWKTNSMHARLRGQ